MSAITVRPLGEDDWELYRDIRLTALKQNPEAFAARLSEESEIDESTWRERMNRSRRILAEDESNNPIGVVSLRVNQRSEDTPYGELFGLWVSPELRGEGAARELVKLLLDYAREENLGAVLYWVGTDNARGVAFASSAGFLPTEYRRPMNEHSTDSESTEEAAFIYPLGTPSREVPSSVLQARP